jgi:hypothetical protein
MSRWLNQVNNFLETLDGQAETVVADGGGGVVPGVVQSVSSRAKQLLLLNRRQESSEEEEEESDDEEDSEDDDEDASEEGEEEEEEAGEDINQEGDDETSSFLQVSGSDHMISSEEDDGGNGKLTTSSSSSEEEANEKEMAVQKKPVDLLVGVVQQDKKNLDEITTVENAADKMDQPQQQPVEPESASSSNQATRNIPDPPVQVPAQQPPLSTIDHKPPSSSSASDKKYRKMMEHLEADQAREKQTYQRIQSQLETELRHLRQELQATNAELSRAAIIVEQERKAAAAERNDLLEEQEEDLQQCKDEYEAKLRELQKQLLDQRNSYETKLAAQEQDYQKEGGDLTVELSKLRAREKTARGRNEELSTALARSTATIESLEQSLAQELAQVVAAQDRAVVAERATALLEQQLDELQASHSKQWQQRLTREAELESAVANLSQQVAHQAQMTEQRPVVVVAAAEAVVAAAANNYQSPLYQTMLEELEATKSEMVLAQQRCSFLQNELDAVAHERVMEVQALQQQLQDVHYQLRTQIADHESATNVFSRRPNQDDTVQTLQEQVERANEKISSVTDQLLRQQGLAEEAKSEVMALKGRLQVALARADAADEQQHQQQDQLLYQPVDDLEEAVGGGDNNSYLRRRRVKGGGGGGGRHRLFGPLSTRNNRPSLSMGLRSSTSSSSTSFWQRQLGETLDALDGWLLETGQILRHEPLARLALIVYLGLLHLWCFGLIVYHTIQSERTGFATLADRSRIPHLHHYDHASETN